MHIDNLKQNAVQTYEEFVKKNENVDSEIESKYC